jgi:hypothetical protein
LYLLSSSIYLSFFLSFLMQLAIREGKNHRHSKLIAYGAGRILINISGFLTELAHKVINI